MFAFWFVHAWLALAAVPIGAAVVLVHLLRPARHTPVRWAAMQFLVAALAESRRRLRLERWLLLVVRTVLLMLLAMLLARPIQRGLSALFAGGEGTALLVIVDNGLAMQAPSSLPSRTLMEEALGAVSPVVHAWHGQTAVLPALGTASTQWVSRADWAEAALDQVPATAGRADWPALLARARQLLPTSGVAAPHRSVLLLTSLTRGNWPGSDALSSALAALGGAAGRVILVDVQPASRDNLAVVDLAVESAFAGSDLPVRAQATVINHGSKSATGVKVIWSVDGRQLRQDDPSEIPAGSARRLLADIPAFGTGEHNVEVHLAGPGDALKADDQRWFSLLMPKGLRIIVVEPDLAAPPATHASLFVTAGLQSAMQQSSVPVRLETIGPGDLSIALFEPADVILLCDAGSLTAADWQQLAEQARQGCGLLAWLGSRALSQHYEHNPHDVLAALPLGAATVGDGQDWTVNLVEPVRPAFLDLAQESSAGSGTGLGSVRQLVKVQLPGDAQVLARTAAGDPLVLLRQTGKARSILVVTSPDLTWNNMASRPTFPAFVLGLLREVLAGQQPQVTCGEPIRLPMIGTVSTNTGRWIKPDGTAELAQIALDGGRREVVLPLAAMPGAYQLETSAGSRSVFASADAQGGNLAALGEADRRQLSRSGLGVVASKDILQAVTAGTSDEWTGLLAGVLLAILVAELLLTGWFTRARQA